MSYNKDLLTYLLTINAAARSGGAAAEQKACRKLAKYRFRPIAAETLGPLNETAIAFLSELDRKSDEIGKSGLCLRPVSEQLSTT